MLNETRKAKAGRWLAMVGIAGMAAAAIAAQATDSTPAQNGLMTFPNVRVVNAPQLANSPAPQTGLKAYIDPETGQFRGPTQEELLAESQAAQPSARLAEQRLVQEAQFVTPSGAIGVSLGESSMIYSVVQKTEGGALAEFCVVGPEQATKMMNLKAPELNVVQRKEIRNVR